MPVAQSLNSNTYFQTVGTSSVSITLVANDISSVEQNALFSNTGTAAVFAVFGIGSAPTAVYPTSATVPVGGKIIPTGSSTFSIPAGTTHISFISTAAGNGVGVSVGQGV